MTLGSSGANEARVRSVRLSGDTSIVLLGALRARLTSAFGESVIVHVKILRALCATLDGQTFIDALTDAGVPCDAGLAELVALLIEKRIVSSASDDGHCRNAMAVAMFDRHAQSWSSHAYAESLPDHFAHQRLARTVALIAARVSPPATVLDVGCGSGVLTVALAKRGYTVIGVDASEAMLRLAHDLVGRESADVRARVSLHAGDVRELDGPLVDCFVGLGLMAWFDDPGAVLDSLRGRLRRGCFGVLDFPNGGVTPDGVLWPFEADCLAGTDIDRLVRATSASLGKDPAPLIEALGTVWSDVMELVRRGDFSCAGEASSEVRGPERRFLFGEVRRLCEGSGFEIEAIEGIGEVRSLWNCVVPVPFAALLNRPLKAIQGLPMSVLWSTGFLTGLRASKG